MADAKIRAVITAEDRASGVINKFSGASIAAFGAIAGVAQSVTSKAIDSISASISTAVKRVDTLNNSSRVFDNMGFAANDVKVSMDGLKQSILGLPTPLDQAVRGMQMIASTTPDIKRAQQVYSALNDAIIGFGGSADMVENATIQISQAFSNGKIDAQTWNSMMQSGLGPTLNAIAKQMGITTGALKDGLSDSSISVQSFQDALIQLDTKGGGGLKSLQTIAKDATAGISTGIENAKTAMARGVSNIIQAIGPARISGAISKFGELAEDTFNKLAKLIPNVGDAIGAAISTVRGVVDYLTPSFEALWNTITTKVIPSFQNFYEKIIQPIVPLLGVALVGSIQLLTDTLTAFLNVVSTVTNFLANNPIFSAATLGAIAAVVVSTLVPAFIAWASAAGAAAIATIAATWPILAIGAAIGAVAYLVVTHWDTIKNAFGIAMQWIGEKVTWLKDHFWESIGFILGFFATLPIKIPLFVAEAITAAITWLSKVNWGAVFSTILNAWKAGWQSMWDTAVWLFNSVKNLNWGEIMSGVAKGIGNSVLGMIEGAINGALNGIPGSPKVKIPRFASGVQNFSGGLAVVGERGPELVNLPRGADVIPNNQIGSVGGSTTVNISINSVYSAGTEMEKRKFAVEILNALQDVANSKNMTVGDLIG